MLIESKIKRPGGSYIELGGITYHFAPNAEGRHVCEVDNDDHVDRLLAIPEGFRLYRDKPVTAAPEKNPKKEAKVVANAVTGANAGDDETSGLTPDGEGGGTDQEPGDQSRDSDQDPAADDREALVALYVEKYGRKPHGKWDAERIRKELESE